MPALPKKQGFTLLGLNKAPTENSRDYLTTTNLAPQKLINLTPIKNKKIILNTLIPV
jgi:hypothetical protein